jgi:cell division protein FtsQ
VSTRAPAPPRRKPKGSGGTAGAGTKAAKAAKAAVDPRMRERRVAVQRDAGRRRLRRLLFALGALAVLTAAVGIVLSPLLALDDVAVAGAGDRAAEVRAVVDDDLGSALLLLDTGAVADRVEALPWVASARVERELPNAVRVTVTPRVPVAFARAADGTVGFVDGRGVVLAVAPAPPLGLPELLGTTGVPPLGGRLASAEAARVAAALGPLAGRVVTIVVAGGQATLHVIDGPEVRFGALDRLAEKARAADAVLGATAPGSLTYLDVRVPSAPVTG